MAKCKPVQTFTVHHSAVHVTERYRPSTVRYREICLFMFISRGLLNRLSLFNTVEETNQMYWACFLENRNWGVKLFGVLPFPLPFPFLSLTFTSLPLFPFLSSLRSRTLEIQLGGLGSAVSSPPGLRQSPSRNRIWCIFALKCDIWWHQF